MHYRTWLGALSFCVACGNHGKDSGKMPQKQNGDAEPKEYVYLSPVAEGALWGAAPWLQVGNLYWESYNVPWGMRIRPGEEAVADDLVRYEESSYRGWLRGLATDGGRVAARPFRLTFEDKTAGKVKGHEKIISPENQTLEGFSPLAKRWKERCPVLFEQHSFLRNMPIHVVWSTQSAPDVADDTLGFYRSPFSIRTMGRPDWNDATKMSLGETRNPVLRGTSAFSANPSLTLVGEENLPDDATEWMKKKQLREGNQTSWDKCGAPIYAWDSVCEDGTSQGVDITFSHEFGHHIFDTWAALHGRHAVESETFAENMAVLFELTCYGGVAEAPYMLRAGRERYLKSDFWEKINDSSAPYSPLPFGNGFSTETFAWLKSHGILDTNKIMKSILLAWERMDGSYSHKVYCSSKYGECPWGEHREGGLKEQVPSLDWPEGEPRVWTYVEFLQRFIEVYDFETPEMRAGFEKSLKVHRAAVADVGNSDRWEY